MKLKVTYDNKEDIPEGYLEVYEERDGKWHLQAEGVKTEDDVDRMKQAMQKQKDLRIEAERELSKYKGVDLEKWEKLKDIDPDKAPGDKEFSEKLRDAEERLEQKYESKLAEAENKAKEAKERAKSYVKESWTRKMLSEKFGFENPRRLNDFVRALNDESDPDFRNLRKTIDSIKVVEENGQYQVIGGDFEDSKGAKEALERIATSEVAKHYKPAPGNDGGGSDNKGKGEGSEGKVNPYKKDTWNVTKQAKLEEENPSLAQKMAEEAGVKLQ